MSPLSIKNAAVVGGRGRGKTIGIPTINIDPANAPEELKCGIYACFVTINGTKFKGAMHYGPRPVFKDTETLEIHILDAAPADIPATVDIDIIGRIRDVEDFATPEALTERIQGDIAEARAMLEQA